MTNKLTYCCHLDGSVKQQHPYFADADHVSNGAFGFSYQHFVPNSRSILLKNCFQGWQISLGYQESCSNCLGSCQHVSFFADTSCFQLFNHLDYFHDHVHWHVKLKQKQFQRLETQEDLNLTKHLRINLSLLIQSFFIFAFQYSQIRHSRSH